MKKKRGDETRHIEGWQSKNERIESLLNVLYDFRFNTVKSRTEYRTAGSSDLYQPVTKFALNTFRRRLDATADIATSTDNIRMILESDFARKAHPIQEYFNALPLFHSFYVCNSVVFRSFYVYICCVFHSLNVNK